MMWVRVRRNVPLRIAEWLGGIMMVLVGLYLVIWPASFQRAGLSGFAAIAPASVWVGASLVLGAARIGALVLNGHKPVVSAPIRCLVAIMGVGLFSSIAAGYSMAQLNPQGPPLAVLFALVFMVGDVFNAARSGLDSYTAYRSTRQWTGFSH